VCFSMIASPAAAECMRPDSVEPITYPITYRIEAIPPPSPKIPTREKGDGNGCEYQQTYDVDKYEAF
jgi:hypothetical protein